MMNVVTQQPTVFDRVVKLLVVVVIVTGVVALGSLLIANLSSSWVAVSSALSLMTIPVFLVAMTGLVVTQLLRRRWGGSPD